MTSYIVNKFSYFRVTWGKHQRFSIIHANIHHLNEMIWVLGWLDDGQLNLKYVNYY